MEDNNINTPIPLDVIYEELSRTSTTAEFQQFVNRCLVSTIQHCAKGEKDGLTALTSIKKRLANETSIIIPIEKLSHFIVSTSHPAEINLAVLFLDMGFLRSKDVRLKVRTSVALLTGIDTLSRNTSKFFHMFASVAEHMEAARVTSFGKGTTALLAFIRDFLIAAIRPQEASLSGIPGLSEESAAVIFGDNGKRYSAAAFHERKEALGKFLLYAYKSSIFTDKQLFLCALVMACDQSSRNLADDGNDLLKRLRIDAEDPEIVIALYDAILGEPPKRMPCNEYVQTRAFEYLSRSALAANTYPHSVKAITQCLLGIPLTTTSIIVLKLKERGLIFTQWTMNQVGPRALKQTGAVIAIILLKFIKSLKNVDIKNNNANTNNINNNTNSTNYIDNNNSIKTEKECIVALQRISEFEKYGFHAMAVAARKVPEIFKQDPSVLEFCIHSLSTARGDLKFAVQSAIRNVSLAYINPSPATATRIENALSPLLSQRNTDFEYAAASAAIRVFPFGHPFAVYSCLVCSGSQRQDAKDEGARGLRPYVVKDGDVMPSPEIRYPDFDVIIEALGRYFERDVFAGKVAISFAEALHFLQKCLQQSIIQKETPSKQLSPEQEKACERYLALIKRIVSFQIDATKVANASQSTPLLLDEIFQDLYELLCIAPKLRSQVQPEWLYTFFESASVTQHENLSKCLAIVIPDKMTAAAILMRLSAGLGEAIRAAAHFRTTGFCLGIGYVLYRFPQGAPALVPVLAMLLNPGESSAPAACAALGLAARTSPEPLSLEVGNRLFKLVKANSGASASERSVCEAAVRCIGSAFLNAAPVSWSALGIESLFGLSECKSPEVLLAAGEALCYAAMGRHAGNYGDPMGLDSAVGGATGTVQSEPMRSILTRIKSLSETSQLCKSAACTWLYAIVAYCGKHDLVQANRCGIQECFLTMLTHQNEITRDTAARGVVALYETCPERAKTSLIDSLMNALSSSHHESKDVDKVIIKSESSDDNAIFPVEGATLLAGRSELNPYRELSTVAKELGRPELVYCFVSLTIGNNGNSSDDKGGKSPFTDILERARTEGMRILPRAFPLLFRGAYDPDPRISKAMSGVLSALLGSLSHSKRYLCDNFAECAKPIVEGMASGAWRTALSSTAALADVLSTTSVPPSLVTPYVVPMLKSALRATTHDKAAVRQAGVHALGALRKLTVRLCDPSETPREECVTVLAELLPLLLPDTPGLGGAEVRAISIELIQDICHVSGRLLEPHVPVIVESLIQEMSFQEFSGMNTIALRMGEEERESFDIARGRLAADSPIGKALGDCIQNAVCAGNVESLCDRIAALALKAAGLPSRVGAAQCAILLCNIPAAQALVPQYAARLARSFIRSVFDESAAVRRSHANALACVLSLGSEKLVRSAATRLRERYIEAADSAKEREACGFVFRSLLKGIPQQKLVPLLADFVPIIIVGSGDADAAVSTAFEDARAELPVAGLHQFKEATGELALSLLDSKAWPMKARGAKAISTLAKSVGNDLNYKPLLDALVGSLGRSKHWDGKETLVDAVADVCTACDDVIRNDDRLCEVVFQCVVKEYSKKSSVWAYRKHASACICSLFDVFSNVNPSIITANVNSVIGLLTGNDGECEGDSDIVMDEGRISDSEAVKRDEKKRMMADTMQSITVNLLKSISKGLALCVHPCDVTRRSLEVAVLQFFRAHCEVQCGVLSLIASALQKQGSLGTAPVPRLGECITGALAGQYESVKTRALDVLFALFKQESREGGELVRPCTIEQMVELVEPIAFSPSASTQLKHKAHDFLSLYQRII